MTKQLGIVQFETVVDQYKKILLQYKEKYPPRSPH